MTDDWIDLDVDVSMAFGHEQTDAARRWLNRVHTGEETVPMDAGHSGPHAIMWGDAP